MPTPPAAGARPALPRGSLVALLTPFTDDLRIDLPTLRRLIDWHIGTCTLGIVIAGTTGECSALSHTEHRELLAGVAQAVPPGFAQYSGDDFTSLHEARALFMESSPGPAKYAAQLRGLCGGGARRAAGQAGCLIALPKK